MKQINSEKVEDLVGIGGSHQFHQDLNFFAFLNRVILEE